jgi:hypothetical protein
MINRDYFFSSYKESFGTLSASKKTALSFLLDKLDSCPSFNLASEYAYILATVKHECNDTYKPVVEGYWLSGNRKLKLYNYYKKNNPKALKTIFPNGTAGLTYEGRGYVQCTHDYNYKKFSKLLSIDLTGTPDLAMDKETAWNILEIGMFKGLFTTVKLSKHISEDNVDYYEARTVINGHNEAGKIAAYAEQFYDCIEFE